MKRRKRSAREWRGILDDQERSGQTVQEYCDRRRINASMFYRKRQELQEGADGFIEVSPRPESTGAGIVVEAGGIRVEVRELWALSSVVAALRAAPC